MDIFCEKVFRIKENESGVGKNAKIKVKLIWKISSLF